MFSQKKKDYKVAYFVQGIPAMLTLSKEDSWEKHLAVCLRYFCINIFNMMVTYRDSNALLCKKVFSH